jgi:ribosomal protein L35AE/L33A
LAKKKSTIKKTKKPAKKPAKKAPSKLEILGMEGAISNYRRGRHTLHPKQCILVFPSIQSRKEANKLSGKIVLWVSSSGKELKGTITRAHGNNGAVRAHFKKAGVPGQALGTKIKIIK